MCLWQCFHFESQTSDKGLLCHKLNVKLAHKAPLQKIFYDFIFCNHWLNLPYQTSCVTGLVVNWSRELFCKTNLGYRQLSALEEDKNKERKLKTIEGCKICFLGVWSTLRRIFLEPLPLTFNERAPVSERGEVREQIVICSGLRFIF